MRLEHESSVLWLLLLGQIEALVTFHGLVSSTHESQEAMLQPKCSTALVVRSTVRRMMKQSCQMLIETIKKALLGPKRRYI